MKFSFYKNLTINYKKKKLISILWKYLTGNIPKYQLYALLYLGLNRIYDLSIYHFIYISLYLIII